MFIVNVILSAALAMIVHELGHMFVARRCNVHTSEIGLGIGPRLFGFRLGGLRLSLRAFPVGSFVLLDGSALEDRSVQKQLWVHLGGIILNVIVGLASYGTVFGWMNLLLAGGNLLPLYQHDGWKCGVVIMRALLRRKSQPIERAFTYSGGFLSLVLGLAIIRAFI